MENKSNATSIKYRNVGNKLFRKGEFLYAAVAYNKAICYAETNLELALAYSNRSAMFLEELRFDQCLMNIQWARENEYPADKLDKLKEREDKCIKLKASGMKDPEQVPEGYFNLSLPPNPKIPFMADCLEIRNIGNNNRGIFTKRNLKAGDIVAVEESVFSFADGGYGQVDHCYNCMKVNMMNLIPCLKSASLMFCSTTCRETFYETFDGSNYLHSQLRKFIREGEKAFGSEGLFNVTWFSPVRNVTYFDFDLSNPDDPEYKRNLWKSALAMNGMIGRIEAPLHEENILENDYMNDLYCKHLNRLLGLEEGLAEPSSEEKFPVFNHGRYLFHGLRNFIQHSCVFNTMCFTFDGNKKIYCITKPIKAGEPLFRNYLNHDFIVMKKGERTRSLQKYEIVCSCFACTADLTVEKLKVHDQLFLQRAGALLWEQMCGRAVKQAHNAVKIHWEAINAYHSDPYAKEVPYLIDINAKLIDLLACKAAYPANTLNCRCFDCPKDAIFIES